MLPAEEVDEDITEEIVEEEEDVKIIDKKKKEKKNRQKRQKISRMLKDYKEHNGGLMYGEVGIYSLIREYQL